MKSKIPKPLTVAAWVDRFYKPERLQRSREHRANIIADRSADLSATGWTLISRHESITGEPVVLYDPTRKPQRFIPAKA